MLWSDIELLTPKTVDLFSLSKAILALLSVLHQSSCNKNSQTFSANSFVPDLFKWTLLYFKSLFVSITSVWSTKVISRSLLMFISQLFISCALLFRLIFRRTISNIITLFLPSDNAMSVNDHDMWLAVLLLWSSFVPTCNIIWISINSQMVGLEWLYMQLTSALRNDLSKLSFLLRSFLLRGNDCLSPSMNTLFLALLTCFTRILTSRGLLLLLSLLSLLLLLLLLLPPLLKSLSLSLFELKL